MLENLPFERTVTNNADTSEREVFLAAFITERVRRSKVMLTAVRQQWKENFDCFAGGSKFFNKEDWQSQFSVNEVASSVRAGVSKIRNQFLKRPDWFTLQADSEDGKEKQSLLDKAIRYQLKRAKFRRTANTFLLSSSLAIGVYRVGWKMERIKNPKLILQESDQQVSEFNKAVASSVANPQVTQGLPTDKDILDNVDKDIQSALNTSQGVKTQTKIPEFIQRGVLELKPVNPMDFYFDPQSTYPDQSPWHAEETYVPLWMIKKMGELKIYKNTEKVVAGKVSEEKTLNDSRFKNLSSAETNSVNPDLVKITEYFGNIVKGDKEIQSYWHVVLANDSIVLRDKSNVFWADGYDSPYVIAAVHEVPFKATGAAMIDGAVPLQRILDSNYQLMVDQMRLGIVGLNIIDKSKVVDPSVLLEGIEPGKYLEVNGEPDKVFKHYNLTSNVENQVLPMNQVLVQGIQKVTGVNPLIQGYGNMRSRTTAAEVNTQQAGSEGVLYTNAEDLEIQWLIPMLEKVLARILQFGLDGSDPQFLSTLDDSEQMALQEFTGADRYNNYAKFWEFEINGFANESARLEELQRINEALALFNQQGPLSQIINGPYLVKEWASKVNFQDPSKVVADNSEIEQILSENRLLSNQHDVSVNPNDNDELHLANHQKALMLNGGNTPQMQRHIQQQQMQFQAKQQQQLAMQKASQTGMPPKQVTTGDIREAPNAMPPQAASRPNSPRPTMRLAQRNAV